MKGDGWFRAIPPDSQGKIGNADPHYLCSAAAIRTMKPEAQWDRRKSLGGMLTHAAKFSPYYREQEWADRLRAGQGVKFREIPITAKSLVRNRTAEFFSSFVPPAHGEIKMKATSGSTGEPMEVRKTLRHYQINAMENQRLQRGWGYGGHERMLQLSVPMVDHPTGQIVEEDMANGGRHWKLYTAESRTAFNFLLRIAPSSVSSSPSLILSALQHCEESSQFPPLKLVSTSAEVVPDELRDLMQQDSRLPPGGFLWHRRDRPNRRFMPAMRGLSSRRPALDPGADCG